MQIAFQDLSIVNNAWSLFMAHSDFAIVAFIVTFVCFLALFKFGFRRLNYGFALIALFIAILLTALLINCVYGTASLILFLK